MRDRLPTASNIDRYAEATDVEQGHLRLWWVRIAGRVGGVFDSWRGVICPWSGVPGPQDAAGRPLRHRAACRHRFAPDR